MKKDLIGIFISLGICCFVNAEICSFYNKIPISKYSNLSLISESKSYNVKQNNPISINIKINYECDTLILSAKDIPVIYAIELRNIDTDEIYSTDLYSSYGNDILKISFAKSIPQGRYILSFNCNYLANASPILSEWFVLSNFDDNNLEKSNSESVRIWLRKSALGHGKYLLENAQNLLRAFKEFTGTAYNENKFVKLDLFVMPKSSTSKHHHGDFIYVDEKIFVNEENIATENNEKLFRSIAENMINQVLKNNNFRKLSEDEIQKVFLKEYLTYYITDKAIKNWHSMDLYAFNQRFGIFEQDFVFNRLINGDGNHFRRGGFIVRMIANIVGDYNFNNYLRERNGTKNVPMVSNKIGRVDSDEKCIENTIKSWRYNPGLPVVMIKRDYEVNEAIVTQQCFSKDNNKKQTRRYWIPLNFVSEDDPNFNDTTFTHWFDPEVDAIEIVTPPQDKWLICNKQQFGFYRVNYDKKNWKLIINYMNSENYKKIHVLNRAQLLDDAFVFAEFGQLNYSIAFDLAKYLKYETEYVPWATFWDKLERLLYYSSISSTKYYEPFKKMILELSGPLERKFLSNETSNPNDRMERLNRISFIKWTCFYGSTLGCNYSLQKLKNWLDNPLKNPILEDFQKEIMCSGIRTADNKTWYKLLDKFQSNKEKMILDALMCTSKYELLEELIMMFLKGQLTQQNPWYFLITVAQKSPIGLDSIIRFLDSNQNAIHQIYKWNHDHYPLIESLSDVGEMTRKKTSFHELIESFCLVIEQFATNYQQFDKLKRILYKNIEFLGQKFVDPHFYYTKLKVRAADSVSNSMTSYWKAS